MNFTPHTLHKKTIAEVLATDILIQTVEDGLQILADFYYQNFDGIIINEVCITPDFFDLKTGIAGEILQKFSNYRMQLAIVGNFDRYTGKSIRDFIYESNLQGHIIFVQSTAEAIERFR